MRTIRSILGPMFICEICGTGFYDKEKTKYCEGVPVSCARPEIKVGDEVIFGDGIKYPGPPHKDRFAVRRLFYAPPTDISFRFSSTTSKGDADSLRLKTEWKRGLPGHHELCVELGQRATPNPINYEWAPWRITDNQNAIGEICCVKYKELLKQNKKR